MPLFLSLVRYTEEGRKNVGQAAERYRGFVEIVESNGGKVVGAWALMGEWDVATLAEFSDERAALRAMVALGKTGRVETRTLSAIPVEDYVKIAREA